MAVGTSPSEKKVIFSLMARPLAPSLMALPLKKELYSIDKINFVKKMEGLGHIKNHVFFTVDLIKNILYNRDVLSIMYTHTGIVIESRVSFGKPIMPVKIPHT